MTPSDGSRRRLLRWATLGAGVIGLALLVLAAARLVSVSGALRDAESDIQGAAALIKDGQIGDALDSLDSAQLRIDEANLDLRTSPSLALLGWIPGVRQNLDAVEQSVEVAATVVHGGRRILRASTDLQSTDGTLQVSLSAGTVDSEDVEQARVEVAALRAALPGRVPSTSRLLLPATKQLFDEVYSEAATRRAELDRLDHGLTLVSELVGAERPRRYLLAIANTAEMRGTGGMILNYGVLEGDAGTVDLVDFGRVEELEVAAPVDPSSVGLPDDYLTRWNGFAVTQEWRNATMAGDFPLVAPALEAMYRRATGLPVDGVIQVDPAGLAAVLEAVGPVAVPEVGLVDSANVEQLVLNEAYVRFPGVEERTDVLGDVAEAAFRRLVDGEYPSVRDLAASISQSVAGRHIVVHSRSEEAQRAIERFDACGSLPVPDEADYVHLTLQNLGGNKLDYYVDTAMAVRGNRPVGEVGDMEIDISIRNGAPVGQVEPRYIFGPFDEEFVAGQYRGVATLYLPTGSSLEEASGGPLRLEPSLQTEDARPLVGFIVDVAPGQTVTATLRLRLAPRSADAPMVLVPQARVRPTSVSVDIETDSGPLRGDVVLDRTWSLAPGRDPVEARSGSAPGT